MSLLLKPLAVKSHVFHNRLIHPAICIGKAHIDGSVSLDLISHYETLSRGGYFSLVVVPDSFVSQEGRTSLGQLSSATDPMIKGLASLSATIKNNGSKAFLQLNHAGSCTFSDFTGLQPVAPSEIPNPRKGHVPRKLELSEIESLVYAFRDAALRAKAAGFDGVEIHSAHGYLLNQFYSPLTNKRMDQFGGTLNNRIRIHKEIIETIRSEVGEDFLIALRFGALDYMEGGSRMEDGLAAARVFEKAGVDMLSISGGMCGYTNPLDDSPGYFSQEAKAIKAAINIPVILTGGVRTPENIEKLLKTATCHMVGVGRAALEDANWAQSAVRKL